MNDRDRRRLFKALDAIRYECEYEDALKGGVENFILKGALGAGIGDKTLQQLEDMSLITSGPSRWSDATGFRITDKGRETVEVWRKIK